VRLSGSARCRAAIIACSTAFEAESTIMPNQADGKPSQSSTQETVTCFQLGCRRAAFPEHRICIQCGREQLAENPRSRGRDREVGVKVRMVPMVIRGGSGLGSPRESRPSIHLSPARHWEAGFAIPPDGNGQHQISSWILKIVSNPLQQVMAVAAEVFGQHVAASGFGVLNRVGVVLSHDGSLARFSRHGIAY